ncbi:uncharacterized protein [Ptychodera flava]|uniref:uncharacterized protein n=1 Tax=Ptychodera flava TaxID=63121 RepID=UPI00396A7255
MASHVACFQTEQPRLPPLPQQQVKGHGAVSDYEKHVHLHDFVIPTVQDKDSADIQPQPTQNIPIPMAAFPSAPSNLGDPELCLSPERPERPLRPVDRSPEKPHVHKHRSDELTNGVMMKPLNKLEGIEIDVRPVVKKNIGKRDKSGKRSTKENEERNRINRITMATGEGESHLSKPIYNSTVALGQQLQALKQNRFDAESAVLQVLHTSEATQCALNERVSETVNVPTNEKKYSGLISVDVPVEETVSHVIEEKMSKVKARPEKKPKEPETPGPDIMEFFTPELQEETAHWYSASLPKVVVSPEQAPENHGI